MTDFALLAVGATALAWLMVAVRPRIGDDLEVIARWYLQHRAHTQPVRLARTARRQTAPIVRTDREEA